MKKSKIFSASLLVAGTAIGAGMLALPVSTGGGGFWPACLIYLICWVFMAATGLLLLEACMWLPRDSNIISLASHLLGKKGKMASWALYLFLFYCLTIAYAAGGGGFVKAIIGPEFPAPLAILLFVLLFSPLVYIGTKAVDRFNVILMAGLVVSFIAFIAIGVGGVEVARLERVDWPLAILAMPIVFTSFSYQGIVPSMTSYFAQNSKQVRKVILLGSFLPLVVYVLWEYLILGLVPLEGANGLLAAQAAGQSAVAPLKHFVSSPYIYALGQAFAFFALTTSFLGVTLGLFDFMADGLKMEKKGWKKGYLFSLVFLPPTLIAMLNPGVFLSALRYAGGIGCALLLGLIPVLMVWSGRYRKKLSNAHRQLPGGKIVLSLLALFVVFELIVELAGELVG